MDMKYSYRRDSEEVMLIVIVQRLAKIMFMFQGLEHLITDY